MTIELKLHKADQIDNGELHIHLKHGDDLHFDTDLVGDLPSLTFDQRDKQNHKWWIGLTPETFGIEWQDLNMVTYDLFTGDTTTSTVDTTGDFHIYAMSQGVAYKFEIERTQHKGKPHLQAVSMQSVTVVSSAVPEPTTSLMLGLGLVLAFVRRVR